jgi:hypothetical protein
MGEEWEESSYGRVKTREERRVKEKKAKKKGWQRLFIFNDFFFQDGGREGAVGTSLLLTPHSLGGRRMDVDMRNRVREKNK